MSEQQQQQGARRARSAVAVRACARASPMPHACTFAPRRGASAHHVRTRGGATAAPRARVWVSSARCAHDRQIEHEPLGEAVGVGEAEERPELSHRLRVGAHRGLEAGKVAHGERGEQRLRRLARQARFEERRAHLLRRQLVELVDEHARRGELVLGHAQRAEQLGEHLCMHAMHVPCT